MSRSAMLRPVGSTSGLPMCAIGWATSLHRHRYGSRRPGARRSRRADSDPATSIEQVMDSAPVTFRPNVRAGDVPDYFKKQGVRYAIVTTSDGGLVGLIRLHPAGTDASRDQT